MRTVGVDLTLRREEPFYPAKAGHDLSDHPIGKIVLLLIVAKILKRQDRYGRSASNALWRCRPEYVHILLRCVTDESETFTRVGADQVLHVSAVADGLARGVDPGCERGVRDNSPTPHSDE